MPRLVEVISKPVLRQIRNVAFLNYDAGFLFIAHEQQTDSTFLTLKMRRFQLCRPVKGEWYV